MSLNPWNKRVHCTHSWAVYSFSVEVLAKLLDTEVIDVPVMYGAPFRISNLKAVGKASDDSSSSDAPSIFLVDNTLPTCALCDPGLFGADMVLEMLELDTIDRPIWIAGIPRGSNITQEQIDLLDRHFAPYQLDLNESEFETALQHLEERVKRESDLARVTYEFLNCHPEIGYTSYLGAKNHADYELTSQTLRGGFTGYIDFMLTDSHPRSVLAFLDAISSAGMDVEFLSVDQDVFEEQTIIRLKCTSNSTLEHLNILEQSLSALKTA